MKTELSRSGLKIFINDEYIKLIPSRYLPVVAVKHILNFKKKRLTREERWLLEIELLRYNLKNHEPFVFELIKKSIPKATQWVNRKESPGYPELIFKNGKRVRCSSEVHTLSINKLQPLFRNY